MENFKIGDKCTIISDARTYSALVTDVSVYRDFRKDIYGFPIARQVAVKNTVNGSTIYFSHTKDGTYKEYGKKGKGYVIVHA